MSGLDAEDPDGVVIGREGEALALGPPSRDSTGSARIPIQIRSADLQAIGAIELEPWSGGIGRLPEYFDDLAANWSGWEDSMDWRDDSGTVAMSATHDRKAIVTLRVTMRDNPGIRSWNVEFNIDLEPGSLETIASDVRKLVPG